MGLEKSTQSQLKGLLKEYTVAANDPKVKGDWDKINSLFPELENIDKDFLKNYANTANNPDVKGDWDKINSLFPQTGIEIPKPRPFVPPPQHADFVNKVSTEYGIDAEDLSDFLVKDETGDASFWQGAGYVLKQIAMDKFRVIAGKEVDTGQTKEEKIIQARLVSNSMSLSAQFSSPQSISGILPQLYADPEKGLWPTDDPEKRQFEKFAEELPGLVFINPEGEHEWHDGTRYDLKPRSDIKGLEGNLWRRTVRQFDKWFGGEEQTTVQDITVGRYGNVKRLQLHESVDSDPVKIAEIVAENYKGTNLLSDIDGARAEWYDTIIAMKDGKAKENALENFFGDGEVRGLEQWYDPNTKEFLGWVTSENHEEAETLANRNTGPALEVMKENILVDFMGMLEVIMELDEDELAYELLGLQPTLPMGIEVREKGSTYTRKSITNLSDTDLPYKIGEFLPDEGGLFSTKGASNLRNQEARETLMAIIETHRTGKLATNFHELPEKTVLAKKYNEYFNKLKILNRAVRINADLTMQPTEGLIYSALKRTGDKEHEAEVLANIMDYHGFEMINKGYKRPTGLGGVSYDAEFVGTDRDARLYTNTRWGTTFGMDIRGGFEGGTKFAADLAPFLIAVATFGRLGGRRAVKSMGSWVTRVTAAESGSLLYRGFTQTAIAAGEEILIMSGADITGKLLVEPATGLEVHPIAFNVETGAFDPLFAGVLGASNIWVKKIAQKLGGSKWNAIKNASTWMKDHHTFRAIAQGTGTAAVGTATLTFAEGINMQFDEFAKTGKFYNIENIAAKFQKQGYDVEESKRLAEEEMKMHFGAQKMLETFIGMMLLSTVPGKSGNRGGFIGNVLKSLRNDVLAMSGKTKYSKKAAETLDLPHKSTPEEIAIALKKKKAKVSRELPGKENKEKRKEEFKKLEDAAQELQNVNEWFEAKRIAQQSKGEEGYYARSRKTGDILNSLLIGKNLTDAQGAEFEKLSEGDLDFLIKKYQMQSRGTKSAGALLREAHGVFKDITRELIEKGIVDPVEQRAFISKMYLEDSLMAKIESLKKKKKKTALDDTEIKKLEEDLAKVQAVLGVQHVLYKRLLAKRFSIEKKLAKIYAKQLGTDFRVTNLDDYTGEIYKRDEVEVNRDRIKELESKKKLSSAEKWELKILKKYSWKKILKRIDTLGKKKKLTREEKIELVELQKLEKKWKEEALQSEGFFDRAAKTKENPQGVIWINEQVAFAKRQKGVFMHEVVHRLLMNSLKTVDAHGNAVISIEGKEVIDNFLRHLSEKERDIVKKRFERDYKYEEVKDADGNITKREKHWTENYEEYITAFSDALKSGEISYSKKLGEVLSNNFAWVYRKLDPNWARGERFSQETGKGIYNMIKELYRTSEKGKISQELIDIALTYKDIKGAGLSKSVNTGSKQLTEEAFNRLKEEINKLDKDPETGERYTDKQWMDKMGDAFLKLGHEKTIIKKGDKILFDGVMIEPFVTSKIFGTDIHQEISIPEFIKEVKEGVMGTVMRYKPSEGAKTNGIYGWIMNEMRFRKGDVTKYYKKIKETKEELKKQQVIDQDTPTKSTPETEGPQIRVWERLGYEESTLAGEVLRDKIHRMIESGEIDYRGKSFKTLRRIVTLDVAKMLIGEASAIQRYMKEGLSEKAATKKAEKEFVYVDDGTPFWKSKAGKKLLGTSIAKSIEQKILFDANLNKQDIKFMQMEINKIGPEVFINVVFPEGHTTAYKATWVPKKVLKEFYNKSSKRILNSFPQLKNPHISPTKFLEFVGITERGKPNLYKKDTNTGQSIKAVAELFERMFLNQAVREKLMAEGKVEEALIAMLGEGKPVLAFARAGIRINEKDLHKRVEADGQFITEALAASEIVKKYGLKSKEWENFKELIGEDVADLMIQLFQLDPGKYGGPGGYIALVKAAKEIDPDFAKRITDGELRTHEGGKMIKAQADKLTIAVKEIVKKIDTRIFKIIDFNIFGFQYGYLDSAKEKRTTGEPGEYYETWKLLREIEFAKELKFDPNLIMIMNKDLGIAPILKTYEKDGNLKDKLEQLTKDSDMLLKAGETNIEAFIEVALGIQEVYKNTEFLGRDQVFQLYQIQTNIVKGFRGLSRAEYMWVHEGNFEVPIKPAGLFDQLKAKNADFINTKDYKNWKTKLESVEYFDMIHKESLSKFKEAGEKGGMLELKAMNRTHKQLTWKGEHMMPNARTMAEISVLTINGKLTRENLIDILEQHTQLFAPTWVMDKIDTIGKTNPEGVLRALKAKKVRPYLDNIYHVSGVKMLDYLTLKLATQKKGYEWGKVELESSNEILEGAGVKSTMFSKTNNRATENKRSIDKAFSMGRRLNKERRGMSAWDFDDTLARTKSGVNYRLPNPNYKPGTGNWYDFAYQLEIPRESTKKKIIFLAGGPGSGKSSVIKQSHLREIGFKIVNQDIALEWLMKNHGMPANMRDYTPAEMSKFGELAYEARIIAIRKKVKYVGKGDGVIVDGTGASLKMMEQQVKEYKDRGYDVSMIYVETSLKTALERNRNRKERSLIDKIVIENHEAVQANKPAFKKMFGETFGEVKTDNLKQGDLMPNSLTDVLHRFVAGYSKGRLNASEYADKGTGLKERGAEFDFAEFDVVKEGERGPLFGKAMDRAKKFGTKDQFIVTARPHAAKPAIYEFLKAQGLNIPLKNIITLENSSAEAKAMWMVEKFAEGYNDMYFADDALQNVKAVKNVLGQLDVKSKVQQAYSKTSIKLDKEFNIILEYSRGIGKHKRFSPVTAYEMGRQSKYMFVVPTSIMDMRQLLQPLLGKGMRGIENEKWFQENFLQPYSRGVNDVNLVKTQMHQDYRSLINEFKDVRRKLKDKVAGSLLTHENAIRIYLWNKAGFDIPGLSKTELKKLTSVVSGDVELLAFAKKVSDLTRLPEGYVKPGVSADWLVGSISKDLFSITTRLNREKYLAEWIEKKNAIFSEANLNKLEVVFGKNYREALEDVLYRMENNTNRNFGNSKEWHTAMNVVNGTVGGVMFFNLNSATGQLISTVHYLNYGDNNIVRAGARFLDRKQFAADFVEIWNSGMMLQRRKGLRIDIAQEEIVSAMAESSKDGAIGQVTAAFRWMIAKGYLPTKYADSFAIAMGGASFYRNRINTYKKTMSETDAKKKAWQDFAEKTEERQQSSRPDFISKSQAGIAGRLLLNWANTPIQMFRVQHKEIMDIAAGRFEGYTTGENSLKAKVSKIAYYGFIQSAIFFSMQQALWAIMGSDDEDFVKQKELRVLNGMLDSYMLGYGVPGKLASTVKNTIMEYVAQEERGQRANHAYTLLEATSFSPPANVKARKFYSYTQTMKYKKDIIKERGFHIDNPAAMAYGKLISSTTNFPLDVIVKKMNNLDNMLENDRTAWQRLWLFFGKTPYILGIEDPDIVSGRKRKKSKNRYARPAGTFGD